MYVHVYVGKEWAAFTLELSRLYARRVGDPAGKVQLRRFAATARAPRSYSPAPLLQGLLTVHVHA